uniref:DNA ligase (ATP) n=1 Tax=Acidobacterium capsulatum TaxID=33075 RepID=A0A7V4XUE0_9BACT
MKQQSRKPPKRKSNHAVHTAARAATRSKNKPLARYQSMRDFGVTPEPKGAAGKRSNAGALSFVVQKHAASHLHYDFRLEWQGVLKSWAIAKGPSYYPGDKRLAVEVEDHPLDYGGFEGIIPQGQYGGGTVMLWDRGTWEPLGDAARQLREGNLKFRLQGEKLKGCWALVRMKGKFAGRSKPSWLLIKEHDETERGDDAPAIVDEAPLSVVSGRDMQQIAEAQDAVWNAKGAQTQSSAAAHRANAPKQASPTVRLPREMAATLKRLPSEALPRFVPPQLATLVSEPGAGENRVYEIKLDGYRIQARVDKKADPPVQLLTRTGLDWTRRMRPRVDALLQLPVRAALLDGELVVLDEKGTTSFAKLQAALKDGSRHALTYFAFDLLHLDGHNLRGEPLLIRKKMLSHLLQDAAAGSAVRLSEHVKGNGAEIFQKACELGAEGVVSKLAQGFYHSGRSRDWCKLKCYLEQELVIGGYTLPSNGTYGVGALLLGYYDAGKLIYAGRTGTGFTRATHRRMREQLETIRRKTAPFAKTEKDARRGAIWVQPQLVAQVSFASWTADGLVRQAAFKGLREDKPAKTVRREGGQMPEPEGKAAKKHRAKSTTVRSEVRLSHRDKVLDEDSGLTKEALADYYASVAPFMLPHIQGRAVSIVRCPAGSDLSCFFQKHNNHTLPGEIESIEIASRKTGKVEPFLTITSANDLLVLAQANVLEIHAWGSTRDSLEKPDRLTIDLDPDDAIDWKTLAGAAAEVRKRLQRAGLKSFLKSTGGKGLHVVAPIEPEHEWPEVKEFAHRLVLEMEKKNPDLYLTRMTKAARKGKIYLDYLRNERGATAIAPFSPRARPGAPVALPLRWSELKSAERPIFRVMDFDGWRKRLKADPWSGFLGLRQSLRLHESVRRSRGRR